MDKRSAIIPKGMLFTITRGVYSDLENLGVFRALKDIDADVLLKKWFEDNPEQSKDYGFKDTKFLAQMVKDGVLEDVPSMEFHLHDYGCSGEHYVYPEDEG